jgi:hypothetical protein
MKGAPAREGAGTCALLALQLMFLAGACGEASTVASGGQAIPRPAPDDDDLWAMVPAEADLVLWADLAKLRSSPWTRESLAKIAAVDPGASEPSFEHIRDVDRLIFAKVPFLRDGASVLVAQGKLDRERISKAFAQAGSAVETSAYRGADMLIRGDEAVAFLSKRTVISGLTVAVRTTIDCNIGVARAIDSESWFQHLRNQLARNKGSAPPVAALYVRLQPATREALKQEMGEGEALEEFAGRIDLENDLDVTAIGNVRTELQAHDLAARMAERIRDARTRPIVSAFGFASVLESLRFSAKETGVEATLHISQRERAEISARMAIVAETMASMRKNQTEEKKKQ